MGFAQPAGLPTTGELLPHHFTLTSISEAVCFCGTFRRVAPPGSYPASCPMKLGLSSPLFSKRKVKRPPGLLAPVLAYLMRSTQVNFADCFIVKVTEKGVVASKVALPACNGQAEGEHKEKQR